jgi:MATE family multidrug resistance protein
MSKNYQLTRYPVGSIRELWALSWPLMLGMISTSMMLFVDRIFLAWYSPEVLNASANAGMAYYLFLVIPLSICAISEVLVGRLHGEGNLAKIGQAVWQMVWFSVILLPLFWMIATVCSPVLFYNSENSVHETTYFGLLLLFAPAGCAWIALSGFFIGIGKVKFVTYCTLLSNLVNVIFGYLLIFGYGPIPSLGIQGAALGMGIAEVFGVLLLVAIFLKQENRVKYGTHQYHFDSLGFYEGIKIGTPAGLGHAIEVLGHFMFFQIVMSVGKEHMTVAAMVQSCYILVAFIIDALSKGVGAIVANLIGAQQFGLVKKVFRAAIKLHILFFVAVLTAALCFHESLFAMFFSLEGAGMLQEAYVRDLFYYAIMWMSIFFLFDGFNWILIGHLTAAGDTKFIFYVSSIINWIAYVLPTFLLVGLGKNGIDVAWSIIALYSMANFGIYYWRYSSGRWLQSYRLKHPAIP